MQEGEFVYDSSYPMLYCRFKDEVVRSSDGGTNWVLSKDWGAASEVIKKVFFSPIDSKPYVYVDDGAGNGKRWTSTDGGASWSNTTTWTSFYIDHVVYDGTATRLLGWSGSDLYSSTDNGLTWYQTTYTANWYTALYVSADSKMYITDSETYVTTITPRFGELFSLEAASTTTEPLMIGYVDNYTLKLMKISRAGSVLATYIPFTSTPFAIGAHKSPHIFVNYQDHLRLYWVFRTTTDQGGIPADWFASTNLDGEALLIPHQKFGLKTNINYATMSGAVIDNNNQMHIMLDPGTGGMTYLRYAYMKPVDKNLENILNFVT
jgi:hypothetical protein